MAGRPDSKEDRRNEARHRFAVGIEYLCPEKDLVGRGQLRDISVAGMFIGRPDIRLEVGDHLRAPLRFFDDATMVWVSGTVVRVEPSGFAVDFDPHHLGDEATLRAVLPLAEEEFGDGD